MSLRFHRCNFYGGKNDKFQIVVMIKLSSEISDLVRLKRVCTLTYMLDIILSKRRCSTEAQEDGAFVVRICKTKKSFLFLLLLKELIFIFLFVVTAAGVVPCGSPKKQPRTSTIVQFIFYFWSFEISRNILRNQKLFQV